MVLVALALVLAYGGFAALSLAMDRHHRQLLAAPPRRPRLLAAAGWGALAAAAAACILHWGWAFGLTAWLGCLTAGAGVLVVLLPYAPRFALAAARVAGPLAFLLLFIEVSS